MKRPTTKFSLFLHHMSGPVHGLSLLVHIGIHPIIVFFGWRRKIKRKHIHIFIGFLIILLGVWVAKLAHYVHNPFLHICVDALGYTIHALGAAPIIKVTCESMGVEG